MNIDDEGVEFLWSELLPGSVINTSGTLLLYLSQESELWIESSAGCRRKLTLAPGDHVRRFLVLSIDPWTKIHGPLHGPRRPGQFINLLFDSNESLSSYGLLAVGLE